MSALAAAGIDARDLDALAFTCLEGCGFCCTFTPEVASDELARLRTRFPDLPVVQEQARTRLAFQGGCGACTLLQARRCTAYGERPAHCRYFPFHVHFGPEPEAIANRSCRGVVAAAGADLQAAFRQQVLEVAPPATWQRHLDDARAVAAEFEENARDADAWGDAQAAAVDLLALGPQLLTPAGIAAVAGSRDAVDALLDDAWDPFRQADAVARPFYLARDLRWLSFRLAGPLVAVEEMAEDGTFTPAARLARPGGIPQLPAGVLPGLLEVLRHLVGRGVFVGQVHAAVDELDYAIDVPAAARARVLGVATELLLRAALLRALGVPDAELAEEAWRFEDAAFLDHGTVGGWL